MLNVGMNVLHAAVRKAKYDDYENNLVRGIKVNPKGFCKYVASQTKVKTSCWWFIET